MRPCLCNVVLFAVLQATASLHCREGQYVSSNDTVSSLLWLLMCYLRKRPLPGQARPPALQVRDLLAHTAAWAFSQTENALYVTCYEPFSARSTNCSLCGCLGWVARMMAWLRCSHGCGSSAQKPSQKQLPGHWFVVYLLAED